VDFSLQVAQGTKGDTRNREAIRDRSGAADEHGNPVAELLHGHCKVANVDAGATHGIRSGNDINDVYGLGIHRPAS
jgi:hypothetical protein